MEFSQFSQGAERLFTWFWRWHYRIPRIAHWAILTTSLLALGFLGNGGTWWLFGGACVGFAISITGIVRWWVDRRIPPVVVIPLFAGNEAKAKEVQRIIVTSLRDRVGPIIPPQMIRPIPTTVDPTDRNIAARIRRRLGAPYLMYGELRKRKSQYSIYARLNVELPPTIQHLDPYTMDLTPQRTIWEAGFLKLSPSHGVRDTEYPFEFADEVQGLIRSVEGHLWRSLEQPDRAVTAYRAALDVAGASEGHAVDEIRVRLALTLFEVGQEDEAITLLRERAQKGSVAPELLRQLATMLGRLSDSSNPLRTARYVDTREEEVELLRRAVEYRDDPQWDSSRYNLAQLLRHDAATRDEAIELLQDLAASRSHYRFAWYMKRDRAFAHFQRASQLAQEGHEGEARREFKEAAKWDSRAIRARPKFRVFRRGWRPYMKRYPRSAKLHAAAAEAHSLAGNRLRARYHHFRMLRRRKRLLKIAEPWLAAGDWPAAYAYYE